MRFIIIFLFLLQISVLAIEEVHSESHVLEGIYGNSGHIGFEFASGINSFDYYYSRDEHFFYYLGNMSAYDVKFDSSITYFSTDFNRYSFLISLNFIFSKNDIEYESFSFGVIDNMYIKDYISTDFGVIAKFEGGYKFFLILGVSYYFFNKRNYHLILSDNFNILLNSVNISNTISLKWMYIF